MKYILLLFISAAFAQDTTSITLQERLRTMSEKEKVNLGLLIESERSERKITLEERRDMIKLRKRRDLDRKELRRVLKKKYKRVRKRK